MLKIDVTIDRAAFKRDADSYVEGPFTDGTIGVLNGAAEAGQRALVQSMPGVFDEPTPFALDSVRVYKATRRTDEGTPSALVFVTDEAAAFLDVEITGGVRRAGDAARRASGPSCRARGPPRSLRQPAAGLRRLRPAGARRRVGDAQARAAARARAQGPGMAPGSPRLNHRGDALRGKVGFLRGPDPGGGRVGGQSLVHAGVRHVTYITYGPSDEEQEHRAPEPREVRVRADRCGAIELARPDDRVGPRPPTVERDRNAAADLIGQAADVARRQQGPEVRDPEKRRRPACRVVAMRGQLLRVLANSVAQGFPSCRACRLPMLSTHKVET
jgi:hypothetical protein